MERQAEDSAAVLPKLATIRATGEASSRWHQVAHFDDAEPFRNLQRPGLVPVEKSTAHRVAAAQGLVARNRSIVFDRARHQFFDGARLKTHQISRSKYARVAHLFLDMHFPIAEDVEPGHEEHDTKSA